MVFLRRYLLAIFAGLGWRELGNGAVDWNAVSPALGTLDLEWALVEQDRTDRESGECFAD